MVKLGDIKDGLLIGDNLIPENNPSTITVKKEDLELDKWKIINIKKIRFTCDNCSSIMEFKRSKYGYFLGCPNWNKDSKCKKNTIRVKIVQ